MSGGGVTAATTFSVVKVYVTAAWRK